MGENTDFGLVSTCATVRADYFDILGCLDSLDVPLVIEPEKVAGMKELFREMIDEISGGALGARAITSALLKKALIYEVCEELQTPDRGTWLVSLTNEQLGKAVAAIWRLAPRR